MTRTNGFLGLVVVVGLLWGALAFGQQKIPASLISVDTNNLQNFVLTESLYTNSASADRVRYTAQHLFDWVDDNWPEIPELAASNLTAASSNWTALLRPYGDTTSSVPAATNVQAVLDSADDWLAGLLGALQEIPTFEPDTFYFMRDTNMTSESNWEVVRTNWGYATSTWESVVMPTNAAPTNEAVFFIHPPFIVADDVMFPDVLYKEEFYSILNQLGFANYDSYTYYSSDVYGSASAPPTNNSVFLLSEATYWQIPGDELVKEGQVVRAHLWGGGGAFGGGGYTYGDFVLVSPSYFETNMAVPYLITTGMTIAVHVGNAYGRAAIWRASSPSTVFDAYNDELLVAGGGGGGTGNGDADTVYGDENGNGGGLAGVLGKGQFDPWSGGGYGGGGGTQTNGGAGGAAYNRSGGIEETAGVAGSRVWGARRVNVGYWTQNEIGGDGYYGGGTGGRSKNSSGEIIWSYGGGGGGSGFVPNGWDGAVNPLATNVVLRAGTTNSLGEFPPSVGEPSFGLNAGYAGNPGRVVFEIKYDSRSRTNRAAE